jgi:hypothetical protein
MSFSRRELLRRAAALVVASRLPWSQHASAATSPRETLAALVDFVRYFGGEPSVGASHPCRLSTTR